MKAKHFMFLIPIAIMISIFVFSDQTGKTSLNLSDGFTYNFVSKIVDFFSIENIDVDALTSSLRTFVRKTAHFIIYALLGSSFMLSIHCNFITLRKREKFLISQLFSSFYAVTDEIHQMFVPGRNCNFFDMCLDSLGAFLGILFVSFIIICKNKLN